MNSRRRSTRQPGQSALNRIGIRGGYSRVRRAIYPRLDEPEPLLISTTGNAVLRGPSIKGKPMKLIEIVSGEVEDRKPSFV